MLKTCLHTYIISLLLANCGQSYNPVYTSVGDTVRPGISTTDRHVVMNDDKRSAYIVPGIIPAPATYKAYHYLEYKYSMRFAFTGCIVSDSIINTIRPNNEKTIAVLAGRFPGLTEAGLQKEIADYAKNVRRWEPVLSAVIPLDEMEKEARKEGSAIWYEWKPGPHNDTVVVVNKYLIQERRVLPLAAYHAADRSVQYPPF